MKEYQKRLVEVDEILSNMSKENLQKIPKYVLEAIKENKDREYIWKYDKSKLLKDQNLNKDTISILSYLNIAYLLNEKQKEFIKEVHKLNEIQN